MLAASADACSVCDARFNSPLTTSTHYQKHGRRRTILDVLASHPAYAAVVVYLQQLETKTEAMKQPKQWNYKKREVEVKKEEEEDEEKLDEPYWNDSVATAQQIPVAGGELQLGTWQGLYLWEHRSAQKTRRITVTTI